MCKLWKPIKSPTFWLAEAPSIREKKWRQSATLSPRLNGRMMNSRFLQPCVDPSSRLQTRSCWPTEPYAAVYIPSSNRRMTCRSRWLKSLERSRFYASFIANEIVVRLLRPSARYWRRLERNGLISFRAFVDWLDEQAESGDVGDAPIMEEGVDGVRIMTVHKAKGLEFPVVLLVDITAKDTREPSKWVNQAAGLSVTKLAGCTPIEVQEHAEDEMKIEQEEAARVLYVAATRARDLLVVCALGDHPYEGWLDILNPVLYPSEALSFKPETKQPQGSPEFGDDTVVARPKNAVRPKGSVSPGLHRPQAGKHSVVWWDPSILAAPATVARTSSRLTKYLKEDESKVRSEEGIRAHEQGQVQRASNRALGSKPEWNVVTATSYASAFTVQKQPEIEGEEPKVSDAKPRLMPEVTVETIEIDFTRPHGKRFGTLVHDVLSVVALDSNRQGIEEIAGVQGRVLGATDAETVAAAETVQRALLHPLLQRAAAAMDSGNCRREAPVIMKLDDGIMVEGIVDVAFREHGSPSPWIVVDYKTDFEIAGRLEEYRTQVGLYTLAISRSTGELAQGTLLRM